MSETKKHLGPSPVGNPPAAAGAHARLLGSLRLWCAVTWGAWLLCLALLSWEHLASVLHPPSLLFIFLLILNFGAALAALGIGLWRILRGPKRVRAAAWLLVSLLPVLSWAALARYAYHNGQECEVPRNPAMILMTRTGQSLMEAQATYLYPHRLESQRLVMFYRDGLTDPAGDLRAMDRHVQEMEQLTGLRLRAKIYWARGRLLGQGNLCCYGIALGSAQSPASELDRHELAHALLNQHYTTATQPPTLLSEGWADSQQSPAGDGADLAAAALGLRQQLAVLENDPEPGRELANYVDQEGMIRLLRDLHERGQQGGFYLRELTDSYWYHRDKGPVYSIGGALVNFLLRKFGGQRFVQFYFACRPGNFDAECQNVFGVKLNDLEMEFWEDAEQLVSRRVKPDTGR